MSSEPASSEPSPVVAEDPAPEEPPLGPGRVVLIVGPSGSGKDTLLRLARLALATDPDVVFSVRMVTRPTGTAEEIAMTPEAFAEAKTRDAFALTWQAHGLAYGIPANVDADIALGRTVVLNASRTELAAARARYAHVSVILVDAPAEVRAARIEARAREGATDAASRLARIPGAFTAGDADVVIMNTGSADDGAAALARAIVTSGRT